ncbi:hypothetical protein M409DRAFT_20276 [Zasmidium cellare ATCC 36951]|uniref:Uncharacterized protein n=1 Tax=Zasmidium cellare ATCC 36951 TaxID=1080233 RepID=A0A6A6CVM5_ZASCE|nr:uncharacterized protein M409DRAFT_20276 [Zasmidium cellare ATCC 36951]KAF2169862.1 hypothetical protein M409DRAFT_20276 [Zasmidium cellare ATCC 36951]
MSVNLSGEVQLNADATSATGHFHKVDVLGSVGFDGEWVLCKFACDGTGDTINLERRLDGVAPIAEKPEAEEDTADEEVEQYPHHVVLPEDQIPMTKEQEYKELIEQATKGKSRPRRGQSRQDSHINLAGESNLATTADAAASSKATKKRNRQPSTADPKPKADTTLDDDDGEDAPHEDQPPVSKKGRTNSRPKATASAAPAKVKTKKASSVPNQNPPKIDEAEQDESEDEDGSEDDSEDDSEEAEEQQEPQTVPKGQKKRKKSAAWPAKDKNMPRNRNKK